MSASYPSIFRHHVQHAPALAVCLLVAFLLAACAHPVSQPLPKSASKTRVEGTTARRAVLAYGDEVEVAVWRQDDLATTAKVDEAGHIHLPLVGEVRAGGRTVAELRADLTQRFGKYLVDPQVTVKASSLKSQTALVLGEVKSQGVVPLDHEVTFHEAIARSGGFTDDAGQSMVVLLRPETDPPRAYILDMRLGAKPVKDAVGFDRYLEAGDIIYVPKSTWASIEEFMGHLDTVLNTIVNAERFVIFMPQLRDAVTDLWRGPVTQNTTVIQSGTVAGEVLNNQGGAVPVQ